MTSGATPSTNSQSEPEMSDDYEVGYRKPPKSGQFQPGQSGNPNGRPKGSKNFATYVRETLEMSVTVTEGGRRTTVSTQQAALMQLRAKALKGDARSLDRLLDLARQFSPEDLPCDAEAVLSEDDQAIVDRFMARVLSTKEAGNE